MPISNLNGQSLAAAQWARVIYFSPRQFYARPPKLLFGRPRCRAAWEVVGISAVGGDRAADCCRHICLIDALLWQPRHRRATRTTRCAAARRRSTSASGRSAPPSWRCCPGPSPCLPRPPSRTLAPAPTTAARAPSLARATCSASVRLSAQVSASSAGNVPLLVSSRC